MLDRRVVAVLCADVAGYSRMMDMAEEETHRRLMALWSAVIEPLLAAHDGRIVKNTGDGFLASFDRGVDAVRCALSIQEAVARDQMRHAADRRILLRIGATLDSVIVEQHDIFGGAVNTAARLQQVAPPGGIVLASTLLAHVRDDIDLMVEDLGRLRLKNLHAPTHAFLVRTTSTEHWTVPAKAVPKRTRLPSVAVLPFQNLHGNGRNHSFAQGMIEDIIGALSSLRDIMVISRGSTLAYSGNEVPAAAGKRLGVRYVVSGTVRRTARQVRVTASLTDVRSGTILWADRIDGLLSSIFDIQDRLATKIVGTIAPHVREAERERAVRKRPENMDAYDLVLQGMDHLYRMDFDQFSRARKFLTSAIEADAHYPPAYAYASLWHVFNIGQGWSREPDADARRAWELATAGVEQDPSNSLALALCGHIKSFLFHEYVAALSYFDRAIDCSPGHAWAWTLSSGTYAYMGHAKAAIERAERGLALSPADQHAFYYLSFLALGHYADGSYEKAVQWDRKAVGQNPRFRAGLRVLAASLAALDRLEEARDVARDLLRDQPSFRVSDYAPRCPWADPGVRDTFLRRLVKAGLPE